MHAFNRLKHADSPPKCCFQARKVQLLGVKFDFSCPVFTYLPPACLLIFSRLNICKCRFKDDFLEKSQRFILFLAYWHLFESVPPTADFQGTGVPCPNKNPPRFHWGERGGFDANNKTRPRQQMSLNCCDAVCLIQKPFPLMRVINTEAALL